MLATRVAEPVHRAGWVYEEKYDGYRLLAYKEGGRVTLLSRSQKDRTGSFPDIARAVGRLPARSACLDGEAVAFDRRLVSRFQLLQRGRAPPLYAVFDCLWVDGRDMRREPLPRRRAALERLVVGSERLFPSRRLGTNGLAAYRLAKRKGFEGLIAKDPAASYVAGRSTRWLKVKLQQEEEFVIGGYTAPEGSRWYFGALLLGAYAKDGLHHVGSVGTGFPHTVLADLHARLQRLRIPGSPFVDLRRRAGATWVRPALIAQVAFQEWTDDHRLRQAVYLGLRDDKEPRECVLP